MPGKKHGIKKTIGFLPTVFFTSLLSLAAAFPAPLRAPAGRQTVQVGKEPWGLSMSTHGRYIYVSNYGSNSISVIDVRKDQVIKTLSTGAGPTAIIAFSDKAITLNTGGMTLTVADLITGQSITQPLSYFIKVAGPYIVQTLASALPTNLSPAILQNSPGNQSLSGRTHSLSGALGALSPFQGGLSATGSHLEGVLKALIHDHAIMARVKSRLSTVSDPTTGQTFTIDSGKNQVVVTGNVAVTQKNPNTPITPPTLTGAKRPIGSGEISAMIDGQKVYTDPGNSTILANIPAHERNLLYNALKTQIASFQHGGEAAFLNKSATPQHPGGSSSVKPAGQGGTNNPKLTDPGTNHQSKIENLITVYGGDGQPFSSVYPPASDNIPHYTVNYGVDSYTVWSGWATHGVDWNNQGTGTQILADGGIAASRSDLWMTADYKSAGDTQTAYPITVYYYDWIKPIHLDINAIGASATLARFETSDLNGSYRSTVNASTDISIPTFGSDTDVSAATETAEAAQDVTETANNAALENIWSKIAQVGKKVGQWTVSNADNLQALQGYVGQVATALGTGYTEYSYHSSLTMPGGETLPFAVGTSAICANSGVGTTADWVDSVSLIVVDQQVPVGQNIVSPSSQPNSYNVGVSVQQPAYATKPIPVYVSLSSGSLSQARGIQLRYNRYGKGLTSFRTSTSAIALTAAGAGRWRAVFTPKKAGAYDFFVDDAYGRHFFYHNNHTNPNALVPEQGDSGFVTVHRLPISITAFSITPNPFSFGQTLKGAVALSEPVSGGKVMVTALNENRGSVPFGASGSPPPPGVVATGTPASGLFAFTLHHGTVGQIGVYMAQYVGNDTYSSGPPQGTAVNMQPLQDTFMAIPVNGHADTLKEAVPVGAMPGKLYIAAADLPRGASARNWGDLKYTPVASVDGAKWDGTVGGISGTSKIIRARWQWFDANNGNYYTQFEGFHQVYFGLPTLSSFHLSSQDVAELMARLLNLLGAPR